MKTKNYHLLLGTFVITGSALILGAVAVLGDQSFRREEVMMETYINESVTGLEVGSPLKFRGVRLGKVEEISLVNRDYETDMDYVLVRVAIYPELLDLPEGQDMAIATRQRVAEGMRVKIAQANITGSAYLEAEYVPLERRSQALDIDWQPKHPYVPSTPSTLLRFTHSLDKVLANLADTDLQALVASATLAFNRVDKVLEDVQVGQLSQDLHATLNEAKEAFTTMRALLDDPNTRGLLQHLDLTMTDLQGLLQRTDKTMQNLQGMVQGRSQDVGTILANLRGLTQNLQTLSSTLERYPSLLLLGKEPQAAGKVGK